MSLRDDVEYVLKTMYATGLADEALRIHPLTDKLAKIDDFAGLNYTYAIKYANSQNIATGEANLSLAQAVATSSKGKQLTMSRMTMIGEAVLPVVELKAAMRRGDTAFATLIETEVDGIIEEYTDRRGFQLYRDGTGARGQRASLSTNTIAFVNVDDARNWKQGMQVTASPNSDGSSPRATSGTVTVSAVDTDGGTITVNDATLWTGFINNDYLFSTPEIGEGLEGLSLLTPATSPVLGSDSFRGIDRGADPARLAGSRILSADATGTIEENAARLATKIRAVGGKCDFVVMNSLNVEKVRVRLQAKTVYQDGGGVAQYGFAGFSVAAPGGNLMVMDDPDCPTGTFWVGKDGSHEIHTLDDFVHIGDEDGNWAIRKDADDELGVRVRSIANYCQVRPMDFGTCPVNS